MGQHRLQRRLLVREQAPQGLVGDPDHRIGAPHPLEAFGEQCVGHARAQEIQPLDLAGLDGEFPLLLPPPDIHGRLVDGRLLETLPGLSPASGGLAGAVML